MTLPEPRSGSTRSRPPVRRTRRPPESSVPIGGAARHGQGALDLGQRRRDVRRRASSRSQRRRARRASGRLAARHGPGVGGVGQRLGRQRVEQRHLVAQHAGLPGQQRDGVAARPPRAHSGSSSWRTRLRTKAGSSLLGSQTGIEPEPRRTARASRAGAGRAAGAAEPGSIPARPSAPAPRSRLTRIVSAWSSMVCPVATPAGSTAKRAARARASRLGPGATDTRRLSKRAPNRAGRGGHHVGLVVRAGAQAVVDVDRGDVAPGRRGQDQEGQRVGAARDRAGQRASPAGGRCTGVRRSADEASVASGSWGRPHPPARATQAAGSRISSSGGQPLGPLPHPGQQRRSAGRLHRLDEALALGVLAHLGVEAEQLRHQLGQPAGLRPALVQHLGEVGGARAPRRRRPGPW